MMWKEPCALMSLVLRDSNLWIKSKNIGLQVAFSNFTYEISDQFKIRSKNKTKHSFEENSRGLTKD